jgi:hypothetical protein
MCLFPDSLFFLKREGIMNKKQFKNLSHSFRWMKNRCGFYQSLAWIKHLDYQSYIILEKIYL